MREKLLLIAALLLMLFLHQACLEFEEPVRDDKPKWEVFTTKNGLISDTVWSMSEDIGGKIWIGAANGLCSLKNSTSKQIEILDTGFRVNKIKSNDEYVMIATNLGAYVYFKENIHDVNYEQKNCIDIDFFDNSFWCLYEDGELFINEDFITVILGSTAIYANGESLWFCFLTGIIQFSPVSNIYTKLDGMSSSMCFAVYQDSKKTLWAGTFHNEGLSKIKDGIIENYNCGYIRAIAEDQDGNMWFGSQYYGLYKLEVNGNLINYTMLDGLPNNKITDILITKNNSIWISTEGGGIAKLIK